MSCGIGIVARLASTRVPRKVLADVAGQPLIVRLIRRIRRARTAGVVILCTSTHPDDRALIEVAEAEGIPWVAGSEKNVLQRFAEAIDRWELATVVRVTGDNPLTDPAVLDELVTRHARDGAEYTFTPDPPRGTRSEVIAASTIRSLVETAADPDSSEYMTDMLRRPDVFRVVEHRVSNPAWMRPDYRLTVDTPEDLELVRRVYETLDGRNDAPLEEVTALLDARPDLVAINAGIQPKPPEAWVNTAVRRS